MMTEKEIAAKRFTVDGKGITVKNQPKKPIDWDKVIQKAKANKKANT